MLDIVTPRKAIETWTMSVTDLGGLFWKAEPGSVIVYAVGDLGHERQVSGGHAWAQADGVAKYAYGLFEEGKADLTQKKLAPNKYEYWCVKR